MKFGRRASLLVAAALLIPACGKSSRSSAPAGGSTSSNVLFTEDFNTVFPGTQWTAAFTTGSGASMIVDGSAGSPAPSLALTTTAGPSFVGTTTQMAFASRPITVTVRMSASSDAEGSGGVAILDSLGAAVAAAEWHPATPGAITLRILGSTLGLTPPGPGAGFHTFTFSVSSSGEASWIIDSAAIPAMMEPGFPSDMIKVQIYDNIPSASATTFATFRFDSVVVTSP